MEIEESKRVVEYLISVTLWRKADLTDYIKDLQQQGCELYISPGRAGNEYTCIVVYPDSVPDDAWIAVSRTRWVDAYRYKGNEVTMPYVSLAVI